MKTTMLAALMLAVIALSMYSCSWFSKSKNKPVLTGKWKVTAIDDSTSKHGSFFSGFNADSARVEVSFITDSSLTVSSADRPNGDTAIYHLTTGNASIIVKAGNDSKYDTFKVKMLTDTLLLVSQDSVYVQLIKQP